MGGLRFRRLNPRGIIEGTYLTDEGKWRLLTTIEDILGWHILSLTPRDGYLVAYYETGAREQLLHLASAPYDGLYLSQDVLRLEYPLPVLLEYALLRPLDS